MDYLKTMPDDAFDLAIIDPPYGGGANIKSNDYARFEKRFSKEQGVHFNGRGRSKRYLPDIKVHRNSNYGGSHRNYGLGKNINHWDIPPTDAYFNELFRVSKNQIIWGGNYFGLPPTRCFLVGRKLTISEAFSMAMCEYAWTNFNDNAKWIEIAPQGNKEKRFHPTQKPIKLYTWLLNHYARDGYRILDTHLGSGSSAIAAYKLGFAFTGIEIDIDYYNKAVERLENEIKQLKIF
jgi:site-specific DNA-methyltransferase (adenine-specific)